MAYTPCLKCHDHSKLTGLRRMYVGIGPLVCINNLLITPVGNVLMRLGYQGKGTEDFRCTMARCTMTGSRNFHN